MSSSDPKNISLGVRLHLSDQGSKKLKSQTSHIVHHTSSIQYQASSVFLDPLYLLIP